MSRRRKPQLWFALAPDRFWPVLLRLVEAARRERVRRQVQRVKRRAAKRWPA